MLDRILEKEITQKIAFKNKGILVLGPRQVGKSTLLARLRPQLSVNFADEGTYRAHLGDPSLIKRQVEALPAGQCVLIDEIQRIPSTLNSVQALMDSKRGWRFLLTGSSARKLKRGQANLLPGRIFKYDLFPLTYWELGGLFDLEKSLRVGGLPEIYLEEFGPDILRSYIDIYLREEIQAEAMVRDLGQYSRFLDLAAESSGTILNYSKLSSDSEIPKENLRRYMDILRDTLIAHRLPGFTKTRGARRATQKEKMVFFDLGVRNAVLGLQKNVFTPTELGSLFEQWVFLQLLAMSRYRGWDWKFHYYRDDLHNEVDLIIDTGKKLLCVEIKYGAKPRESQLKGLRAFSGYAGKAATLILVHTGDLPEKFGTIDALPVGEFLKRAGDGDYR